MDDVLRDEYVKSEAIKIWPRSKPGVRKAHLLDNFCRPGDERGLLSSLRGGVAGMGDERLADSSAT
jgi:hypothetical protein